MQGCLRHSDLLHLLFMGLDACSGRNCSSCSAFQPKVQLSLKAQQKLMPELATKAFVWINRQGKKCCISRYWEDQDATRGGQHFDSAEGRAKTDVKRTRTSASHLKTHYNTFWQGERYFLKSNSVSKAHFAQLLQTRHIPRLTGDLKCKFYTFTNFILMQGWSNISHVHT